MLAFETAPSQAKVDKLLIWTLGMVIGYHMEKLVGLHQILPSHASLECIWHWNRVVYYHGVVLYQYHYQSPVFGGGDYIYAMHLDDIVHLSVFHSRQQYPSHWKKDESKQIEAVG